MLLIHARVSLLKSYELWIFNWKERFRWDEFNFFIGTLQYKAEMSNLMNSKLLIHQIARQAGQKRPSNSNVERERERGCQRSLKNSYTDGVFYFWRFVRRGDIEWGLEFVHCPLKDFRRWTPGKRKFRSLWKRRRERERERERGCAAKYLSVGIYFRDGARFRSFWSLILKNSNLLLLTLAISIGRLWP